MTKKKFFKGITNRDFLSLKEMPTMENENMVIEWLKLNYSAANYLKQVLYDYKAFVRVRISQGVYLWQGSNYGGGVEAFDPSKPSSILGRELCRAITEDEIDQMPPCFHKVPGDEYSNDKSEVLTFLMSKQKIFEWLFLVLDLNGIILKTCDEKWLGKENYIEK